MRQLTFALLIALFLAAALTAQAQENQKPEKKLAPLEIIADGEKPKNEVEKMIVKAHERGDIIVGCRMPCDATVDGQQPGFMNGDAISLPKPAYPPIARAAYAQGSVLVQVLIDYDGKVIAAAAISGHPLLQSVSVQAARNSVFAPTKFEGKPAMVAGVLIYNFVAQ
jgi:NADH dehydrogenase FAD-containing subunit